MYCKHCGKPIDEDSTFCRHCGKQQIGDKSIIENESKHETKESKKVQPKKKQQEKNNSRNAIVIFCAGFIVLMAIIVLVICKFHDGDNKRIADITIDKVSKELAEATKRYNKLYSFHEGLAKVCKDEKYGFIDKLGREIVPCKYDDADDFEYGLSIVTMGEKDGVIDHYGNIVIPFKYDDISPFDKDSTARAEYNGKEGIIDMKGKEIIPFEYEECWSFHEGLAVIKIDGLYGFIDKARNIVVPCIYDETGEFSEGLAAVKRKGEWGYIDVTGKVVIPFQKGLTGRAFSMGLTTISRGGFWDGTPFEMAFIDKDGNLASDWHIGEYLWFYNGYANFTTELMQKWGMIDRYGNIVVPCEYSFVDFMVSDEGLVKVSMGSGERDGFYNVKTASLTIPCKYEVVSRFHEGLAAVKKSGKVGFINSNDETIIPFYYDAAGAFSEGFAVVERFGVDGYIDRYGNDTYSIK